ncbi:DUF222 domain-containing protein [Nocardioides sp.]|uniref:HNH endonuclease signature motif containing protein n=1 Tax=Nocardioides sp. TaxID=35761 RepID=UPI0035B4463A
MSLTHTPQHPIVEAVAGVRASLKTVADASPAFMSTDDKAVALAELVRATAQLDELRLRILGDAGDLAEATAARDAAGWLAQHTRTRFTDARADLALASTLDRERPLLAVAMREGEATLAQAHVIRRAIDVLPASVDDDTVARAEEHLVAQARDFGPKELARIGRRILDVVAPDIAEAAEAARLADLEASAEEQTRLVLRRLGDGTTRISGRIPDASAARLATYLESYANPRVAPPADLPVARLPRPRRLGQAFVHLLEAIDATRLPIHGGDATTVVVTIPLASLQAELATAGVLDAGMVPGDELTGDRITAAQARRLACTAKILPVVLGGESLPLDLGRARRLFSPGQRKALLLRDQTCRAEGCDTPGTWSEAHHLDPWLAGGPTDLHNGILLCSHHHHRAHDLTYRVERLPNGDLRFHRRR